MISVKIPIFAHFSLILQNFPVREHFIVFGNQTYCFSRSGILYLRYGNS